MPSATGVVQEAGVPARPAISTRQSRQEPKASTISVAHSLGTWMPASIEARITEVPSGTVTLMPSTVRVTVFSALLAGVPTSISETRGMGRPPVLFRGGRQARPAEIFGEMQIGRAWSRERVLKYV